MAKNRFTVSTPTGGVACGTGGTDKTVLAAAAPANITVTVTNIQAWFNGLVSTDPEIEVNIKRQTISTGTSGGSITPSKLGTNPETIQSTATYGYTVEPTAGAVLERWFINPQTGNPREYPLTREIWIQGGTQLGVCVNNSGTAKNVDVTITCEE